MAKKLWDVLRIAFHMIRRGVISNTKLMITHINFSCKPRNKPGLTNFLSHRRHRPSSCLQEYEFSCSNSPNVPTFSGKHRRSLFNFPCANYSPQVFEEEGEGEGEGEGEEGGEGKCVVLVPKTPEYALNLWAEEEQLSSIPSPFSVRVSDYSVDDEDENGGGGRGSGVDDEAEEFITRFYQQLRAQNR